jgi:general secretion pathway protein K
VVQATLDKRGVALIIVILVISIMVPVTLQLNRAMRASIFDATNLSDGIRLFYVAKSGFNAGQAVLSYHKGPVDALTEDWANMEVLSAQSKDYFSDASFRVQIEDESGKIPLNLFIMNNVVNANVHEMLIRLLSLPEFGLESDKVMEIINSLKDWMDNDDEVTATGAETAYYKSLDRPYAAKNAPIENLEEILMIKGVTKALYYGTEGKPGLEKYLTLYGSGKININTAPKLILRILSKDMTAEMVEEMDVYRRTPGNDLSDPTWLRKLNSTQNVQVNQDWMMTQSDRFRITATGLVNNMAQIVSGVVQRERLSGTLRLMAWKAY